MLPSHSELTYFAVAAETLNISRAAEKLGITQPSLSLSLKKLEHSLGSDLFVRSKSGVRLTRAGERLRTKAQDLLNDWESIVLQSQFEEENLSGTYTLGCHPSAGIGTLSEILPSLLKKYPKLQFKLKHDFSRVTTDDVINYKVDYAISINPVAHPDLVIKEVCKDKVTFWESPQNKNPDVLICDPNLLQSQSLFKKANTHKKFKRTITSSNLEMIVALTASGAGVSILPTRVAARHAYLKLRQPKGSWPHFVDVFGFIYRKDMQTTQAQKLLSREMLELLKEHLN